jgi:hypothetical protein
MAHFSEHCRDCERILGNRCENVNHWMDAEFVRFGPLHRFSRHHSQGVEEAGELFGPLGRKAAMIHILKDCGWIPRTSDWADGQTVDSLGIKVGSRFNGYWDSFEFEEAAKKLVNGG